MKNKRLNLLVKTSIYSRKLTSVFFGLFVILSTVFILEAIGIILPLRSNIENKVNNHISAREFITEFSSESSDDYIESMVAKIRNIDFVSDVYRMPAKITVNDNSELLADNYTLGYVHRGSSPIITSGKMFSEDETGVAIVPEKIKDFNQSDNKIYEIDGQDLIGKTLELDDGFGNTYKTKIVGAYSTSDPIFSGEEIIIPQSDLSKYNETVLKNSSHEGLEIADSKSYIIVIESAKNADKAEQSLSEICSVYKNMALVDSQSYNVALYILLTTLGVFLVLVAVGFYMFLKNNINNRTNELALYRSLGYKSKHIFYIIFAEHFILGVLSLLFGVITTILLNCFVVNPYLDTLVGNTIMEMTSDITVVSVLEITVFTTIILVWVCRRAVKRSEKIDLTVLLREK